MKSAGFDRVLASTAFGLVLVLSNHPGMAQRIGQQNIDAAAPMPEASLRPSLTANDVADIARQAPPEAEPGAEPKQETAAPASEPAQPEPADSAVSQQQIGEAVPMPETTLPPPLTAKDIASSPNAAPAETAKAARKQDAATPASATADGAVADQLRDMIASKLDRIVKRKADREGVESFYRARNYAPLWVSNGDADARAKAAIAYLAQVDSVGLDPNDYPTPDFKSVVTAETLAQDELKLTASVLSYARQAQIGRIHFSRVGTDIQFNLVAPGHRHPRPSTSGSHLAPAMRSAASASTSPTSFWSISTTHRTNIYSRARSAPTATAACGCRTR